MLALNELQTIAAPEQPFFGARPVGGGNAAVQGALSASLSIQNGTVSCFLMLTASE